MPTPKEYRQRAHECLELTDEANQWYVKTALLQLAAEFQRRPRGWNARTQASEASGATPGECPQCMESTSRGAKASVRSQITLLDEAAIALQDDCLGFTRDFDPRAVHRQHS
jgi:hypothetical protein